jgi:hypothetical protein
VTEGTMRLIIAGVVLGTVGLILFGRHLIISRGFLEGYRGAIGFKNRSDVAIGSVRLTGLSTVVETATLAPGEHSFNYLKRQVLPATVEITWRSPAAGPVRVARVSLTSIPSDRKDGEIFFVLSEPQGWTVESSPELRLDQLMQGK